MTDILSNGDTMSRTVRTGANWFLALGILFLLAGLFALAMPMVSTLAIAIVISASLIVSGIGQIIHAFMTRTWSGFFIQLLMGVIVLVGGAALYFFPLAGVLALTLMVAAIFVAKGIAQIGLGFQVRPYDGWGWIVAAGAVSLLVGLMIFANFPFSGISTLGILAGISLAFTGWSYIAIALAARRLA